MSQYLIFAPILSLLLLGAVIALKSGVMGVDTMGNIRVVAGNFSALMIRVAAFLGVALILQYILNTPSLLHLGH